MNKIKSREISVVVQGPIHHQDNLTKRVLESVREHLPDAELVLSTWKGSDCSDLCFDVLVDNDDPGAFNMGYSIDNVNRQILSTLNGLKSSKNEYTLKIRTDTILTSDIFLSFFFQFPKRNVRYSIFNNRVITLTLFSRDPSLYTRLFHPSDIAQFGSRADLVMLWDVPLLNQSKMPKKEFTEYVPESYIFLNSLKRNGFIEETYRCLRFSMKSLVLSENFLVNNFVFLPLTQFGIHLPPHLFSKDREAERNYSFEDWRNMYEHYCVRNREIPTFSKVFRAYHLWSVKWLRNRGIRLDLIKELYDILNSRRLQHKPW